MIQQFAILDLFQDYNIPYSTSGPNVTKGWVEIRCPYPFCSDPSAHLGVNLKSGIHNCWVCGSKGGMERLLQLTLNIGYNEAKSIIKKYSFQLIEEQPEEETIRKQKVEFLKGCTKQLPQPHKDYLMKRRFDPEYVQQKYKLWAGWKTGFFAYRIVIPIYKENQLISMTGRTIGDGVTPKYKNLPNDLSITDAKDCCYNIDSVKNKAVLVEGALDVWRIGEGAIGLLGKTITAEQLITIMDKQLQTIYVMFDSDAKKRARETAGMLSSFVKNVEVIEIKKGDPDKLPSKDVDEIKKLLKE